MRESGPVRKRFSDEAAAQYVGPARLFLGQMKQFMETFGIEQLWRMHELDDGTRIRVGSVFGQDCIEIEVIPVEEIDFSEFCMWSGFVQLREEDGIIWQNGETRALYGNYANPYFSLLCPKIGVDGGEVPPSYTTAYKNEFVKKHKPGNYTGKLKWLVAGKYALKDGSVYFNNVGGFAREYPANGRLSGEGICTDADGRYWFLLVDETGQAGTATLLATELQFLVDGAKENGVSGDELTQIETHALAIARKTDEVLPITFTGDEPLGLPLGYGWHFNERGSRAVIVTHEFQADTRLYQARKYVATITGGANGFTFLITVTDNFDWNPSQHAEFLRPFETSLGREHCPLGLEDNISEEGEATDVIVYAYYNSEGMIIDVEYTTSTDTNTIETDECGNSGHFTPIEGYTLNALDWAVWSGERIVDSITADSKTLEAKSGTRTHLTVLTSDSTTTSTSVQGESLCCSGGPSIIHYTGPCSAGQAWWYGLSAAPCSSTPGACGGLTLNERCSVHWTRTTVHMETTATWEVTNGSEIIHSAVSAIIPFDCADGVIAIKGDTSSVNRVRRDGTGPTGGVNRSRRQQQWDSQCSGFTGPCAYCDSTRTKDSGDLIIGLAPIANWTSVQRTGYEAHSERVFFHRHGHFAETEYEESETDAFIGTPWDVWLAKWLPLNDCVGVGATVWTGILTEDVKATAHESLDYDIDGDFPEDAELANGWT